MAAPPATGYADLLDELISVTYPEDVAVEQEAREDSALCVDPFELEAAGNVDALQQILQDGSIAVNRRSPTSGRALLHEACVSGRLEVVKLLVQHPEIDLMLRTMLGRCTPLHLAVANSHRAVAFMLLSHGADAQSRDRFGCSPLHYVKSVTVAKLLVQYGGKVLDYNSNKKTALEIVEAQGDEFSGATSDEAIEAATARAELIKYMRSQSDREFKTKLELLRQKRKKQAAQNSKRDRAHTKKAPTKA